jgi:hypothetical protein
MRVRDIFGDRAMKGNAERPTSNAERRIDVVIHEWPFKVQRSTFSVRRSILSLAESVTHPCNAPPRHVWRSLLLRKFCPELSKKTRPMKSRQY